MLIENQEENHEHPLGDRDRAARYVTELNNYGFHLERRHGNSGWEKLGFVSGKGTTTKLQNYSYTDKSVQNGKYYYRLKQVDTATCDLTLQSFPLTSIDEWVDPGIGEPPETGDAPAVVGGEVQRSL